MSRRKKIIIPIVVIVLLAVGIGAYLYPKEIHMPTWMTYPYDVTIKEGYATINKYLSDETEVNIPKRILWAETHAIERDVFEDLGTNVFIKSIPESVAWGDWLYHRDSQSYYHLLSGAVLVKYVGNEKKVEIPEEVWGRKVTDISYAFYDSEIEEVTIPETVTSISGSFVGCKNLKQITLPDKLVNIWRIVFQGSGIESIEIPESVEIIDSGAFAYSELKEITGLENVKYFGNDPFRGTPWEENIEGDFVCLGDLLLLYRGEGEEVVIPSNVKEIKGAFSREEEYPYPLKLRKVFIPDSVKIISAFSFKGQEGIEVYIPETVESIGKVEKDLNTDTIFSSHDKDAGTIVTTAGSPAEAYAIEEGISYRIITKEEMQQEMEEAKKRQNENAKPDFSWINAYVELLNGDDFKHDKYALAYIDEDSIPELVGHSAYKYQISTCLTNGTVFCCENMEYGTHSRMYYFLPKQNNIVGTCTGDGGVGAFEEYYVLKGGDLKFEMYIVRRPQFDDQGNLLYDDSGNYIWSYEKDDEKITEEMWKSMTMANEEYIDFEEIEYMSKEEMLDKLLYYCL